MSFAGKWMELEHMLSEVSQVQKDKGHMFSITWGRQIQRMNIHTQKHDHIHIYM
jgi:hypothetical protein